MSDTIYTYGGGEALFAVLNGVAMIFKSDFADELLKMTTAVAVCWAAMQAALQQTYKPQLSWAAKYVLITTLIIFPKGTVWITDTVHHTQRSVSNLPIGLILPAAISSSIGYSVTQIFEQAFQEVGSNAFDYTHYGTSFGASLVSQAKNFKIQDAVFRENMESFIDKCVMFDDMIGLKYTVSEMRSSNNAWALVSNAASNIKMFNYRDKQTGKRAMVTCKEGATQLGAYWETDLASVVDKFSGTIFGRYGHDKPPSDNNDKQPSDNHRYLGNALMKNIELVNNFYGNKVAASDTLKQLMFLNAMNDIPASYGVVRAKHQQQETWAITGQLARENLPLMHAVFAALIYASFVLILGLLVLPGGFRVLGSYLGLLLWIELWAPLFAVLNMIMNLSSKTTGSALSSGFTMDNISNAVSTQGNLSALAGYLMASIPFISYAIMRGGAGQFVHLAGQLTSASQSAAMASSQEVTSGNRSFDNKSIATSQWENNTAFKTDLNPMTKMGHQEYQRSDGTLVRQTPSGEVIFHAGPGLTTSVGSRSMSTSSMLSSQVHESLGKEHSLMDSKQSEYSTLEQHMMRQAADFVGRVASGEASGEHYNYNTGSSHGQAVNNLVGTTKELHEKYGYDWNQASQVAISGRLGMGMDTKSGKGAIESVPTSIPGTLWGMVHGDVSISASAEANRQTSQGFSEQKGVNATKTHTQNLESVIHTAKDMQFTTNQSNEKSLADSLTGSHEKMQSLRDSISVHQQNIDSYRHTAELTNASHWNVSDEMYHEELKYIAKQHDAYGFKYGYVQAQGLMEKGGAEYEKHHQAFTSKHTGHLQQMPNDFMEDHQFNYEQRQGSVMPQTLDRNYLDEVHHSAQGQVQSVDSAVAESVQEQLDTIQSKVHKVRVETVQQGEKLQGKVNELEKGRWFRGWIGKKKNAEATFED